MIDRDLRKLFVTAPDPGLLLADVQSPRGAFVPTRVPLVKGQRVLLDVRADVDGCLRCELPVVVAERIMPRAGRAGAHVGVVVKGCGEA
jgi:hypothetical protein